MSLINFTYAQYRAYWGSLYDVTCPIVFHGRTRLKTKYVQERQMRCTAARDGHSPTANTTNHRLRVKSYVYCTLLVLFVALKRINSDFFLGK